MIRGEKTHRWNVSRGTTASTAFGFRVLRDTLAAPPACPLPAALVLVTQVIQPLAVPTKQIGGVFDGKGVSLPSRCVART